MRGKFWFKNEILRPQVRDIRVVSYACTCLWILINASIFNNIMQMFENNVRRCLNSECSLIKCLSARFGASLCSKFGDSRLRLIPYLRHYLVTMSTSGHSSRQMLLVTAQGTLISLKHVVCCQFPPSGVPPPKQRFVPCLGIAVTWCNAARSTWPRPRDRAAARVYSPCPPRRWNSQPQCAWWWRPLPADLAKVTCLHQLNIDRVLFVRRR